MRRLTTVPAGTVLMILALATSAPAAAAAMTVTSTRNAPTGSGYLDGVTVGEFTQTTGGAVAIRSGGAPFGATDGRGL